MEPGRLIASGRDGDIFELGPGLVLRRTRDGRSIESEARIMQYVAEHGYPVPAIHEVRAGGSEIVMERIDGPLMSDVLLHRLWTLPRVANTLADLHDRLHAVPGPEWLRRMPGAATDLLHLDLHPLNVIVHPERGPVVVDWSNAWRGDALFDVGVTYVLLTCPRLPGPAALRIVAKPIRLALARAFVRRYRGPDLDAAIAAAAELKTLDGNMDADEILAMQRLAQRKRRAPASG
jgi:aminoglycoside phosphotransferase (APT) family kinase protein